MATNELLQSALQLASLGIRVVPMQATRKRRTPCDMNFGDGCQERIEKLLTRATRQGSTDPDQIQHWWRQRPGANVGILGSWMISAPYREEPGQISLLWALSGIVERPGGWLFILPIDFEPVEVKDCSRWKIFRPTEPVLVAPSVDCSGSDLAWHTEPTQRLLHPPAELVRQVFPEPYPIVADAVRAFFEAERPEPGEVWRARKFYERYQAWGRRVGHRAHNMQSFATCLAAFGLKRWRDRDPRKRRVIWQLPEVLR